MTTATIGSSMPYQTALDWSVPSTYTGQLRNDLTELQAYRAQAPDLDEVERLRAELQRLRAEQRVPDPAKVEAMKARALHAGATKAERLHAVINNMVERHRPQLAEWTGNDTSRAVWLAKQINARKGKFNKDGTPSVSGWRTVYEYLKTLQL